MPESSTTLADRPPKAKKGGTALTVVLQLLSWTLSPVLTDEHASLSLENKAQEHFERQNVSLSSWYKAVLKVVSDHLGTATGGSSYISDVHVLVPGLQDMCWGSRLNLYNSFLEPTPRRISLEPTFHPVQPGSAELLRATISRKEQPIFYVFVTDDLFWSQNPFWTEIIGEDLVEKGIVLGHPAGDNVVKALTSFDKTLSATNQAEPRHTPGSAASASLHEPHSMSAQGDSTPEHDTVDQLEEQPEIVVNCIGKQLNQSGRYRRFVTTGGTDDSESKKDTPTEFSPSPSVVPVEKAAPAQKGDEFLSFLERALSIYEKV
ncbi:hypothetical protein HD553DRAFT_347348 [Filobasidium floriforme]|uniref:uncharacterized protein n=1 Tax=Filobasidium floriforme TaxID=5210 RepID=UPI001E8EC774|nr:uncharacterized protein HD553DRAFT_347348 [Filobasidium floriforme]KAH8090900.1 hypothetical protein HD553DRAFT_347348 [Filobasidium floriforme]